jgi:hypothetical protein
MLRAGISLPRTGFALHCSDSAANPAQSMVTKHKRCARRQGCVQVLARLLAHAAVRRVRLDNLCQVGWVHWQQKRTACACAGTLPLCQRSLLMGSRRELLHDESPLPGALGAELQPGVARQHRA